MAFALIHPIVFYYAGAQRWYPVLMLAHALRHWAILSPAADHRRAVAFVSGAILGVMSSYLDLLFLLHDGAHYAWRGRGRLKVAVRPLALAALVVLTLLLASPIASEHWEMFGRQATASWPLVSTAQWAGLGPLGEALPHAALLTTAPLVVGVALWGGRALGRLEGMPQGGWLVLTLALVWSIATRFGVASPRYSLELWWLMSLGLLGPIVTGAGPRVPAAAGTGLVALGLVCTLAGGPFLKADLNSPPASLCDELAGGEPVAAYVIPYHRITAQLRGTCAPDAELLQLPALKHVEGPEAFLSGLNARVGEGGRLTLLALTSQASIRRARAAARDVLETRCARAREDRPLWPLAHGWLRESLLDRPPHRLVATDYDCP